MWNQYIILIHWKLGFGGGVGGGRYNEKLSCLGLNKKKNWILVQVG